MTSGPDNVNKPIFQYEMLEVEGKKKSFRKLGLTLTQYISFSFSEVID